jgi:hypothetical protein
VSERTTVPDVAKASRGSTKTPPAWLITACMFVGAVLTIVLVITGQ